MGRKGLRKAVKVVPSPGAGSAFSPFVPCLSEAVKPAVRKVTFPASFSQVVETKFAPGHPQELLTHKKASRGVSAGTAARPSLTRGVFHFCPVTASCHWSQPHLATQPLGNLTSEALPTIWGGKQLRPAGHSLNL